MKRGKNSTWLRLDKIYTQYRYGRERERHKHYISNERAPPNFDPPRGLFSGVDYKDIVIKGTRRRLGSTDQGERKRSLHQLAMNTQGSFACLECLGIHLPYEI
jgi:hypothetical protein